MLTRLAPDVCVLEVSDADGLDAAMSGLVATALRDHPDVRGVWLLRHHRLLAGAPASVPAEVRVITPHNIPARLAPS